jgi:hypothetical protein
MTRHRALIGILVIALAGLAVASHAADQQNNTKGVPFPAIAMGQGETCVEDTDFMRRNTVINGVRTEQHSLKECINCHVVNGPDSVPVTVSSPQHFCRSCHDYAAVSVDCFQCHASRPGVEN